MNRTLSILCLLFPLFFVKHAVAQVSKNLITSEYSRGAVNKWVIKDTSWITYPAYADRNAWAKLPESTRKISIEQGEKYLKYDWPSVKATDYLEFTRTGNRAVVDNKIKEINQAYRTLLMAELMEGKGRFMDDLINGVFEICERTYWGSSAHFYLYGYAGSLDKPTTILPDATNPVIDLGVGDMAADLAWSWYLMHDEFDKVSPVIAKRLKDELRNKVLTPYYERNDFWWLYGRQGDGNVNNWNPWVNYNVLNCILLLEDDPQKKADAVYKNLASVDVFLNSYPKDGSCNEGPGYWGAAVGKFFNYLDLMHKVSNGNIDIFKSEKVKQMGRYIYQVYISKGVYYTNYEDATLKIDRSPAYIYRVGNRIGDPAMKSFGAFLKQRLGDTEKIMEGRVSDILENLFSPVDWADTKPVEPLISEFYFPDWDVVVARDKPGTTDGFYFTAKGGHNGEQHNHNDVGSFMLYFNGNPVLLDVGVGTYTKETFGKGRWDIWTMQSNYHNVPSINGLGQKNGSAFRSNGSKFSSVNGNVSFSTDIAKAYTADSKVTSWVRGYTLERGTKFTINDRYQLAANTGGNKLHFMTVLPAKISKPGVLRLSGEGIELDMTYNPDLLSATIETIKLDDPRLINNLGNTVNRLVFALTGNGLTGDLSIEVTEVKKGR